MLPVITAKINELYTTTKARLLAPESYTCQVDLHPMQLYLDFIDRALQKTPERIASITAFIRDEQGLLVGQMMPFALLKKEVVEQVEDIYVQTVKLAECVEILSPADKENYNKGTRYRNSRSAEKLGKP